MLAELKHFDLTGQVVFDHDSPFLAGRAFGDIRIGACLVAGQGKVKVAIKCLRIFLQDSPDILKVQIIVLI